MPILLETAWPTIRSQATRKSPQKGDKKSSFTLLGLVILTLGRGDALSCGGDLGATRISRVVIKNRHWPRDPPSFTDKLSSSATSSLSQVQLSLTVFSLGALRLQGRAWGHIPPVSAELTGQST